MHHLSLFSNWLNAAKSVKPTELGNLSYLDSTDSGGSPQVAGQFIVKILVF
jgi:hypothetical protein